MSIDPISNRVYIYKETKNSNKDLENLFEFVQEGYWGTAYSLIEKNPHLIAAVMEKGPNDKRTILLEASLQLSKEKPKEAADKFIYEVFGLACQNKIFLDLNESPLEGPDQGKSVFWNLAYYQFYYSKSWATNQYLGYTACDVNFNAAPKEGPFKGVTAFSLLTNDYHIYNIAVSYSSEICASAYPTYKEPSKPLFERVRQTIPSALISIIHNIEVDPDSFTKYVASGWETKKHDTVGVLSNCYLSMFKIIEENPNFYVKAKAKYHNGDDRKPIFKPLVEIMLSLKTSPNRDKLLLYLIIAGGEVSETCEEQSKIEYDDIQNRLRSVYQRSLEVFHYELTRNVLPRELISGIARNILLTEFPGISKGLLNKFFVGLSLC